ncbi:MAG: phosphodiester glycosidase family protein, partial [Dokdonella sp.]
AAAFLAASPCAIQAVESRIIQDGELDYRVVTIAPAREQLELRWKDADGRPITSIQQLRDGSAASGRRLLFATNAGIYDKSLRPLGLHVQAGKTLRNLNNVTGNEGSGNFAIQPNGVFWVDARGRAGVDSTATWASHPREVMIASQSGPMLLIDGDINPKFDIKSESKKWRSGVCAPTPDRVEFVVSTSPVSFHEFARVFRDRLGCRDALYLDGTLSRIWTAEDGYSGAPAFLIKPYVGMFAVFAK